MTTIDYKSTCESLRADLRDAGRKIASRNRQITELKATNDRLDAEFYKLHGQINKLKREQEGA